MNQEESAKLRLKEVAVLFLKLGCIGFGGPAVHIAMMEEEVVRKRKWLTHEYFLDLIGATNLIPGPNSTEMTMHIGQERAGWKGLVIAGLCFILPAVIISGVIAFAYQKYGKLPEVEPFLYGIKPAIISVVIAMMISLVRKALKSFELGLIGVVAVILAIYGFNDIYILFGGGLVGLLIQVIKDRKNTVQSLLPLIILPAYAASSNGFNWKVFWIFLKIGAILYGSGYVLFAFLDTELVKTGLLSKQELIDAIAVGQVTPGPVFSSATFIGWQLGGLMGAVAATIGIFLPSFLFVAFLTPLILKLRESKIMSAFLDTINMVSIALIITVCIEMGKASIVDWRTIFIAVVGFLISIKFKYLNSAFVILGGAGLGFVLSLI
ncbi:MAG: chromate efflux transporter [Candidatus Pedobacter colombiensis]|uniref:Chromate efflux transporter n=1 Tax=Candidatus Pedobacter colombiensis TaxID=3121371 RepID=A0AAJ5WDN0_9SPHI|nr:chromate efflux transporter [Pedobacter sp.]WEK21671.1 MAG: chromate efflux transporter [Pedobacter sp.]